MQQQDEIILSNLTKCISLREKYIGYSLQSFSENPQYYLDRISDPPKFTEEPLSYFNKDHDHPLFSVSNDALTHNSNHSIRANIGRAYHLYYYDLNLCHIPPANNSYFHLEDDGVFCVYDYGDQRSLFKAPSIKEFFQDLEFLLAVIHDGPTKTLSFKRLKYLDASFGIYLLLNEGNEIQEQKTVPHRDFYNVRKVDTHVHHSACMNQKHLLRFIKSKLCRSSSDVVIKRDGAFLTLEEVFQSLNLTAYDLSIDTLNMHAHKDSFHRFDNFNLKYNPVGESRLREIFLKTDNLIEGRYLSELTKEVISDLEANKYQMAEYRISIYGRSPDEWTKLSKWVCDNQIFSDTVRWVVQLPRLYNIYREASTIFSFQDFIKNIFEPLFQVTQDPSSNKKLHIFLQRVVAFDSVDDESKIDKRYHKKFPAPKNWNIEQNPPYSYYLYYIYANLTILNQYRKKCNLNTFLLRPHSGEAGDPEHLAVAFLTSFNISHGILLRKVPALQYLFYLMQIGISLSPLSNNALFLNFDRNPFPHYFRIGMNVSLSTDDPLQFHFTKEPLIEEYSVAAQIWKLSSADMCEISRNSVLQSGFESCLKKIWLGSNYMLDGPDSNDMTKTNVPNIRIKYRCDMLAKEKLWVSSLGQSRFYSMVLTSILTSSASMSTPDSHHTLEEIEDIGNIEPLVPTYE